MQNQPTPEKGNVNTRREPMEPAKRAGRIIAKRTGLNKSTPSEPERQKWKWKGCRFDCPDCDGDGVQHLMVGMLDGEEYIHHQACQKCHGFGYVTV